MPIYLDIETTSLYADIGSIIVIGVLYNEEEVFFFVDSPSKEKEVLKTFIEFLNKIKNEKIYVWNSNFDIPFLLTRCLKHRLDTSIFSNIKVVDLWKFSKEKLKLSSNSLENVSLFFDLRKNLELRGKNILILYEDFLEGKLDTKEKIIEHCKDDLLRLKELHEIFKNLVEDWEKQQKF
ncbi:MAG: ribonuclease H-like domain-containing protein [Candidatus Aenigmatarchaeota archaeon]